jgi:probable F420-dependent oxidoreductase
MNQVSTAQLGSLKETVGPYGIWSFGLRSEAPEGITERAEAVAELEELGFRALWLGGSPGVRHAVPLIRATSRLVVATGIQSIWEYGASETASEIAELDATHPGRFLLGLGVSHAGMADRYRRPYASMVEYLDALDAAGLPAERRVLAALGPKMLGLSRDRAAGSHPYLVTPEHTAQARAALGETPLLAPELKVVLDTDPDRARTTARATLAMYLTLPNYTNNFLRIGFTEDDIKDGGSDRLVDAVFAWGSEDRIRERIDAFRTAGADHVTLQVLEDRSSGALPRDDWRRLAALLKP